MKPPFWSMVIAVGLLAGVSSTASAQAPASPAPAAATPGQAPARGRGTPSPTRDPHTPGYRRRQGIARRHDSAGGCRGKLHHRPDAHPRAGNDREGGRAARHGVIFTMKSTDSKIYPGIAREPGTFGTPDPGESRQADRDHQPSRALHAPRRGVRAEAIRPRHRSRPSSSAPTGPIRCCSRRWIT